MKEIRFILVHFFINLIIIDSNSISSENFSNNIYYNFIDYSYNKTHCFKNGSIKTTSRNFENCRNCAKIKKKKKNQKNVKNII